MTARLEIIEPRFPQDLEVVRDLFVEYWRWMQFEPTFQGFDEELRTLPGRYAPPSGCVLVAWLAGRPAGCVAVRKLDEDVCEMKRLFVRHEYRGRKIGVDLAKSIMRVARDRGYRIMRLDTLPVMDKAIALYESLGFRDITAYDENPTPGARYMEIDLEDKAELLRLLFVCIENSCRSQMAEAFARVHGGATVEPHSAGSRPSGVVNATAIESMREVGYDLSTHNSKSLDDVPRREYDYVITMGCGDECPFVPAKNREDWEVPDPKAMPADEFRKVRDDIEQRVVRLLARATSRS